MNIDAFLTGFGRRLFQRLMLMLVVVVALRMLGFFMGPGDDGTFRTTSSEMRAGPTPSAPDDNAGWGTSSSKSERRSAARDRSSSEPPVYDSASDGGWGSN